MTPKRMQIVIADDDSDDREMIKEAFEENKLINDLHFVQDGEELMDYLYRLDESSDFTLPGLILLDLNMPKKDGRECLREIKENPILKRIPVVVLTTSKTEEDIIKSYGLGVNAFIVKPVTFSSLVEVTKILGQYWFEIVKLPHTE